MFFLFQAEDGIRDLVRSRGLGDVYKRQGYNLYIETFPDWFLWYSSSDMFHISEPGVFLNRSCLLYTSDAADERSSVDLGGRRIIKKKTRY